MLKQLRALFGRAPEVPPVPIDSQRVDDACAISENFLRIHWEKMTAYAESFQPADHHGAWTAITKRWLENTATFLGDPYHVHENPRALLMTARHSAAAYGLLHLADGICMEWDDLLQGAAPAPWKGKIPILFLEDRQHFCDCIAAHYPDEGEFVVSTGIFTEHGIPHIVIHGGNGDAGPPALVHELSHGCLAGLSLPRWLDEGFALIAERIAGIDPTPDRHDLDRIRLYWRAHGLADFWQGDSFLDPAGSHFSYQLALILVQNLLATRKKQIPSLLQAVTREDGGAAGFQSTLGISLEDLATPFLGEDIGAHESEWTDDEDQFETDPSESIREDDKIPPDKR